MKTIILAGLAVILTACNGSGNQSSENLNAQTSIEAGTTQASSAQYQMKSVISANAVQSGEQRSETYVLRNGSIL